METDLQKILNFGQFLEKYTKIIQTRKGYLSDLHTVRYSLVSARSLIRNMLVLLSREIDVARRKKKEMIKE